MSTSLETKSQVIRNVGTGGIGVALAFMEQRDPKAVRYLVKAVRHHGATLPLITIRERSWGGYDLVDGLLELQAAKILKLGAIRAIVLPEKSPRSSNPRRRS